MSHNKKLKRKQINLDKSRLDINNLVERLNHQINENTKTFDECASIKIQEPLDPKVFDRLMIMRLEDLENCKIEYQKLLEKKKILDERPNFI